MLNVAAVLAREHWTIRDALAELDRSGQGMLLLVDEAGRLKRIVTDGDIRRLLLAGAQLSDTLARLDARAPVTLREGAGEAEAMQLMAQHVIDHVPVIDAEGRPLHVFARRDLDARIYLSAPHLSGHERQFVEEAFRSNWIAPLGPNVDAFEKELAAYTGARHAAALSSGTAALHLALRVLGIGAGDTVFCSTFTFIASAAPIVYERARPVFIDSDFETWNMSPAALEAAFRAHEKAGTRVKAVIVVNLYGQSADIDPIQALCP
jgi:CBS domain-containing protein